VYQSSAATSSTAEVIIPTEFRKALREFCEAELGRVATDLDSVNPFSRTTTLFTFVHFEAQIPTIFEVNEVGSEVTSSHHGHGHSPLG
jgi:hypothetical protein